MRFFSTLGNERYTLASLCARARRFRLTGFALKLDLLKEG